MQVKGVSALLAATILFFVCPAAVRANETVHIAIIADKAFDLDKSPLVSLLESRLSHTQGVHVLERAQIDKILAEQRWSITSLFDRNATIKAGRLLRAEAFVLLSAEADESKEKEKSELVRVRLVETRHGLRLWDGFEPLDAASYAETVNRVIDKVIAAAGKLTLPPGQAIPVGIVEVHSVQLGDGHRWLTRVMPGMLSVRLSTEPRIVMLEREDLAVLRRETLLAEGEDAAFWSSAVLIDGYLERGKDKDLEMKLQLKRASGDEVAAFTVSIKPDEPSLAVDQVADKMIRELVDSPPASRWQPEQEAEEFFQQGHLLYAHARYADAMAPLETASALQPGNLYYTRAIFANEWNARFREGKSYRPRGTGFSDYSDLELANLVSRLVRQIRDGYESGSLSVHDISSQWAGPLGVGAGGRGYFTSPVSVASEQIRQINRANRSIWVETLDAALKREVLDEDFPPKNSLIRMQLVWASSDEPEELIANIQRIFAEIIMPPDLGGQIQSAKERYYACDQAFYLPPVMQLPDSRGRTQLKDEDNQFPKLWRRYLENLTKIDDPVVRFYSYAALSMGYRYAQEKEDISEAKRCCHKALEVLQKDLKTPNEPLDDLIKRLVRRRMKQCLIEDVIFRGVEESELADVWEEIFGLLIADKDIDNLILWEPGVKFRFHPDATPQTAKRYHDLQERIAKVLQMRQNDEQVAKAMKDLRDAQAFIRRYYTGVDSVLKPAGISVTLLLQTDRQEQPAQTFSRTLFYDRYLRARLLGNMLWVANIGDRIDRKIRIELAGIDLAKLKPIARWQTEVPSPSAPAFLTDMVVCESKTCLSIGGVGLVELPGSLETGQEFLKNPKVLTWENGLPSTSITSIAHDRNKLWIAYGGRGQESGLGLYETRTGQWETIFCSTLKGKTPFNAGRPYTLHDLTLMPPNKLFFVVRDPEFPRRTRTDDWTGLWKMNIDTRALKHFRDGKTFSDASDLHVADFGGRWWLWSRAPHSPITEFDFDSETMKRIEWDPYPGLSGYNRHLSTGTFHNGRLWARWGQTQILIIQPSKSVDEAQILDNDILNGKAVSRFISTPYGLVAIGDGVIGLVETKDLQPALPD
ncbi:MAG: hypothetical protein A2Z25_01035 [Planctomycetes bacterium RBG_16_55_9]|nr:MAG: hypothetical protein A2Z25_01035 [Planctomycetes bacterium RBG_16_55_9]